MTLPEEPERRSLNTDKMRDLAQALATKFDPTTHPEQSGTDSADAIGLFYALQEAADEIDRLRKVESHSKRWKIEALRHMEAAACTGHAIAKQVLRDESEREQRGSSLRDFISHVIHHVTEEPKQQQQPEAQAAPQPQPSA